MDGSVVGVHKAGVKDKPFNIARRLTFEMVVMLETWREEMGGDKFNVVDLETNRPIDLSSLMIEEIKPIFKRQQQHIVYLKELEKQVKEQRGQGPEEMSKKDARINELEEQNRSLKAQIAGIAQADSKKDFKISQLEKENQ